MGRIKKKLLSSHYSLYQRVQFLFPFGPVVLLLFLTGTDVHIIILAFKIVQSWVQSQSTEIVKIEQLLGDSGELILWPIPWAIRICRWAFAQACTVGKGWIWSDKTWESRDSQDCTLLLFVCPILLEERKRQRFSTISVWHSHPENLLNTFS